MSSLKVVTWELEKGADIAIESIWRYSYNGKLGAVDSQIKALSEANRLLDNHTLATKLPDVLKAIIDISATSQIPLESPLGITHQYLVLRLSPKLRRATAVHDSRLEHEVQQAAKRLREEKLPADESAMASMLNRLQSTFGDEIPPSELKAVQNELALMMHAGQKTVADTTAWAFKYLAVHQVGRFNWPYLQTANNIPLGRAKTSPC